MEMQPQRSPEEEAREAALQRRQLDALSMTVTRLSPRMSWGERLLPFLMAAMETCWVAAIFIGLVSIHFAQLTAPPLPLWTPFAFIGGFYWITVTQERRIAAAEAGRQPAPGFGIPVVAACLVGVLIYSIWAGIYAGSAGFLDPRWVGAFVADLLLFSPVLLHVVFIVGLAIYFGWRGTKLARREIEPSHIFRTIRLGIGIIVAVMFIQVLAHVGSDLLGALLLLIPLFLSFALLAHSLANAIFLRRIYRSGLQGNVAAQERELLAIIGGACLFLLVLAFVVGTMASPAFLAEVQQFLAPVGRVYDGLVAILSYFMVLMVTPLFWLINLLHPHNFPTLRRPVPRPNTFQPSSVQQHGLTLADMIVIGIARAIIPLLLILLTVLLVRYVLKQRRVVMRGRDMAMDEQESVWSWQLFLAQLKAVWLALWQRFFGRPVAEAVVAPTPEIVAEPAARSIREMYRALLKRATDLGYGRKKDETPFEFGARLHEHVPQGEGQLEAITQAYAAVRYGGIVPQEADVEQVRSAWQELQQQM